MYGTHMRVVYHFCCRQSHSSVEWRIAGPRAATNAIFISRLVMSSSPGLHTNKESSHFRVQILDAFTRVYNSGLTVLYCAVQYSDGSV